MEKYHELRQFLKDYEKNPKGTVYIYSGGNLLGSLTSDKFEFRMNLILGAVEIRDSRVGSSFSLSVPCKNFYPLINHAGYVECHIEFRPKKYMKKLFAGFFDGE